jgi:hypothetical protein
MIASHHASSKFLLIQTGNGTLSSNEGLFKLSAGNSTPVATTMAELPQFGVKSH